MRNRICQKQYCNKPPHQHHCTHMWEHVFLLTHKSNRESHISYTHTRDLKIMMEPRGLQVLGRKTESLFEVFAKIPRSYRELPVSL